MKTFLSLLMSSFYFFNPSIHQYLRIGNDGAYLSSTPQAIELTETNDNTGRYDDANAVTWVIKRSSRWMPVRTHISSAIVWLMPMPHISSIQTYQLKH